MRRLLMLALPAILAGLLTACGGDDSSNDSGLAADNANDPPAAESHDGEEGGREMNHDEMNDEMNHDEAPAPVAPGAREIEVTARSYEFGPPTIEVRAGEDVAIVLSADDIEHDLVVDELDAHISADPGETTRGGLRADDPGTYTYYCSVSGHREAGMEGTLTVS